MEHRVVVVDYDALLDPTAQLSDAIERAFGPDGLGILTVRGVPALPARRARLLPLAARFARLPDAVKARYEDASSRYSFGWSCGREALRQGQPDTHKGSFYANPLRDEVTNDAALLARFPGYCRPNVWPRRELPELEGAFKELGALIIEVGLLLAQRCDAYVAAAGAAAGAAAAAPGRLHDVIARSPCPKGRLLYYFPPASRGPTPVARSSGDGSEDGDGDGDEDGWCGWHTDHGSLTGLTAAMYLRCDEAGGDVHEVPCPDPAAGLYVRNRAGDVVRVVIPPDHVAFQVGEAMQVASGGLLQATPHCVKAPRPPAAAAAGSVARSTFAVFMQPRWDEPLDCPSGGGAGAAAGADVALWTPGATFGDFSERTFEAHYT